MPAYSDVTVLYADGELSVAVYTCRGADPPGPPPEEFTAQNQVVFVRSGSFVRSSPRGRTVADANQALFFQRGTGYRIRHPHRGGDECVTVSIPEADRLAWMESWGASTADGPDSPMPWESGLVSSPAALRLHPLVAGAPDALDPFEWHATVIDLLGGIRPLSPERRPNGARKQGDRDAVEAIKMVMLRRLAEPLRLADLAADVGLSPFALCRTFVRHAGLPVHRYRRRLRLREALRRLADGAADITGLALDLGFSDHSHFTNAFRAEFGVPPSGFRARFRPRR
jgi:AraC-like DNA-binding protein